MKLYKIETIQDVQKVYNELSEIFDYARNTLIVLGNKLENEDAAKYIQRGVIRRLYILQKCVVNVFTIYPFNRTDKLSEEECIELTINLHALLININGILDNLAWIFVYASNSENKLKRVQIGLYPRKDTRVFE